MVYKFTIAPEGAIGTPFRSDTLFGHACWTMLYKYGDDRFESFRTNAAEQKPELVFSDGFPSGWLPRPLLPKRIPDDLTAQEKKSLKKVSKRKWVFRQYAENCNWDLSELDNQAKNVPEGYGDTPVSDIQLRNTIDRLTGTSLEENGLFSYERNWYHGIWSKVDIYVSTRWSCKELTDLLYNMFEIGYGKDQTIGLGKVKIASDPVEAKFPSSDQTEYYLSLSRCVPDGSVSINDSFYQIEPKYGKVWSGFNTDNPFKKRIIQITPGSILKVKSGSETAGKVLENIHDNSEIIENCKTVLYPLPGEIVKEFSTW
jgi:CRISPR-associated protein Csm4